MQTQTLSARMQFLWQYMTGTQCKIPMNRLTPPLLGVSLTLTLAGAVLLTAQVQANESQPAAAHVSQ